MSEQAHVQSFTNKGFAEHVAVGEREEACASYCALQESAAVQILLDVCLTQQQDKVCCGRGQVRGCSVWCAVDVVRWEGAACGVQVGCVEGGLLSDSMCSLSVQLSQPFGPLLSVQREVVCLVCSHLHQVFIGNPTVAKLVHFQVSSGLSSLVCMCSHAWISVRACVCVRAWLCVCVCVCVCMCVCVCGSAVLM